MIGVALAKLFMALVAHLPFKLRYAFSDFLAVLMFHVIGYRTNVVKHNLRLAFPDWDEKRVHQTAKEFYHNLCDILVEVFASAHLSPQKARERMQLENPEVFDELYLSNQGVLVVWGHYTNFEFMAQALPLLLPNPTFAVYQRLNNQGFNDLVVAIRERFGLKLFPMQDTYPFMLNNTAQAPAYIFMADQSPHRDKIKHWETFLGLPTPVHLGVENLSRKLNLAVVFLHAKRTKRGHYSLRAVPLTTTPNHEPEFAITRAHLNELEKEISTLPAHWLWSHKRWKYAPVAQPE